MSELIAFIGVGNMGNSMARNLVEEGNDTKDFSAISKVVVGDAWNYPID